MINITEIMDTYINQYSELSEAEDSFREYLDENAEAEQCYKNWCDEAGYTERKGFKSYAINRNDSESIWEDIFPNREELDGYDFENH